MKRHEWKSMIICRWIPIKLAVIYAHLQFLLWCNHLISSHKNAVQTLLMEKSHSTNIYKQIAFSLRLRLTQSSFTIFFSHFHSLLQWDAFVSYGFYDTACTHVFAIVFRIYFNNLYCIVYAAWIQQQNIISFVMENHFNSRKRETLLLTFYLLFLLLMFSIFFYFLAVCWIFIVKCNKWCKKRFITENDLIYIIKSTKREKNICTTVRVVNVRNMITNNLQRIQKSVFVFQTANTTATIYFTHI